MYSLLKRVNMLTRATERLVSLCGRKLIKDCPTRWSSTYLVIERLLQVKSALATVLQQLGWDNLPTSDWKQLEKVYKLLTPFASLISGEEYVTLPSVIPVVMELSPYLEEVNMSFILCNNTKLNEVFHFVQCCR